MSPKKDSLIPIAQAIETKEKNEKLYVTQSTLLFYINYYSNFLGHSSTVTCVTSTQENNGIQGELCKYSSEDKKENHLKSPLVNQLCPPVPVQAPL